MKVWQLGLMEDSSRGQAMSCHVSAGPVLTPLLLTASLNCTIVPISQQSKRKC